MLRRIPILFGRYLVKEGVVTTEQVRRAAALQRDIAPSIGEAALVLGVLQTDQVRDIRLHQRETGASFTEAAGSLELLTEDELERLEAYQDRQKLPIGEALILQGALDAAVLEKMLDAHRASMSKQSRDEAA